MLSEHAAGSRRSILVIDRDYGTQLHIRRALREQYDVYVSNSGSLGLALLRAHEHVLVIASLTMKGLYGLGIMEAIRALPGCGEIPVIGLIATDMAEDRTCLRAGNLADCLVKPVSTDELCAAVDRALYAAPEVETCGSAAERRASMPRRTRAA